MPQTQQTPQAPAAAPPPAVQTSQDVQRIENIEVPAPAGARRPPTSREMYQAMRAQRDVIQTQLARAERDRGELAQELRSGNVTGADREGIEAQLRTVDARIVELRTQLAAAERQEAEAAAIPGATTSPPRDRASEREETYAILGMTFLFVCVLPISLAYARRVWKRYAVTIQLPPELTTRLDGLERSVDATAIEVERIGEGQRFVTQLLAGRADAAVALPSERER